jgi:acetolactate synthase small subunit
MKHEFHIEMLDDPQALLRVMGYFPQRDLMIDRVHAERQDGRYGLSLSCEVAPALAQIITSKLQQLVLVTNVTCVTEQPSLRSQAA